MSNVVFHYTSREGAHEIVISGRLKPGRSGKIYLTEDCYGRGHQAASLLSIMGKPIEVVFVIAFNSVQAPSSSRPVEPILGELSELRPGGGTELWTEQEIDLSLATTWNLPWG